MLRIDKLGKNVCFALMKRFLQQPGPVSCPDWQGLGVVCSWGLFAWFLEDDSYTLLHLVYTGYKVEIQLSGWMSRAIQCAEHCCVSAKRSCHVRALPVSTRCTG